MYIYIYICNAEVSKLSMYVIKISIESCWILVYYSREIARERESRWKPLTKRSQGRPKYRWQYNIKQDICQMKIKNWIACVQDRGKWKDVVEKGKTFNH